MRRFVVLICVAYVLQACGTSETSQLRALREVRDHWEDVAPRCQGYPSKAGCDDGDMALFGGLLCASGDERGCDLVRRSQSADGRFWRSPRRTPENLGEPKSFSRDMSLGVMLYLVKTEDRAAASKWVEWIEGNRACITHKPDALGGGCLVRGPYRFCTDDANQSCTVTPGNWALFARVFRKLGLEPTPQMRANAGLDYELLPIQAKLAPLGYQTHLPAVETLLKKLMGETSESIQRAAKILHAKQPDNPFFAYLDDGNSLALRERTVELCPALSKAEGERDQWAWERDTKDEAWHDSAAWDCIFLMNLLEQDAMTGW